MKIRKKENRKSIRYADNEFNNEGDSHLYSRSCEGFHQGISDYGNSNRPRTFSDNFFWVFSRNERLYHEILSTGRPERFASQLQNNGSDQLF